MINLAGRKGRERESRKQTSLIDGGQSSDAGGARMTRCWSSTCIYLDFDSTSRRSNVQAQLFAKCKDYLESTASQPIYDLSRTSESDGPDISPRSHQLRPLFRVKGPGSLDLRFDAIEQSFLRLALFTILRVNTRMRRAEPVMSSRGICFRRA